MFAIENPSTGKSEDQFERIDDSQRDDILDRSTAAYEAWRSTRIEERAAVLSRTADLYEERIDELADHIGREMGKLTRWAKAEVQIVADIYRYYSEHAHELLADEYLPAQNADKTVVRKEPIGPLLGIMPWNFPYYQVARFAAPNLLLGNTIVLKHASICPLSSQACQDILEEAGLPKDAYINIYASGSQMDAFVADKRIKGVSLTGSEGAGSAVAKTAGENYKKSVLELGGNDPFLVIDDENLEWVLDQYNLIRMYNTGQACNSNKRMIVMEDIYDEFVAELERLAGAAVPVTPDKEKEGGYSALSSRDAAEKLRDQLDRAVEAGANLRVGGELAEKGAYVSPAVITDIPVGSDIYYEEFFGPVAAVYKVSSDDEALDLANNTQYGLGGTVFSQDPERAAAISRRLECGMANVNTPAGEGEEIPFGGVKRSGFGRELSVFALDEFVNKQYLYVND